MKKMIALSAVLVIGALGIACGGDTATNNALANANKAMANAANQMQSAANQMANVAQQAANQMTSAANQMSNAANTLKTNPSNADKAPPSSMANASNATKK